ncbi:ATP-binding protein [Streptomyces sp. NPDC001941]|uniref:ATP-binding protein n=1 Tax=Streptomyces sp. NPDC001941 TaxID=3154659 RepID=UPI00331EA636
MTTRQGTSHGTRPVAAAPMTGAAHRPLLGTPLRHSTVWAADKPLIAEARDAVRALLARAGYGSEGRTSQDAQLVVSELVTNALRHAPGPGGLDLELVRPSGELPEAGRGFGVLRITVRDGSAHPPTPRAHDPLRIGGHGVNLVVRLCGELRVVPLGTGKQVTAELALGPAGSPAGG